MINQGMKIVFALERALHTEMNKEINDAIKQLNRENKRVVNIVLLQNTQSAFGTGLTYGLLWESITNDNQYDDALPEI